MRVGWLVVAPVLFAAGCSPAADRLCLDPQPSARLSRDDMVRIPGGRTVIGSDDFNPEERPRRVVDVDEFYIDRHEVTAGEFAAFVEATGYRTVAERDGGAVFRQPERLEAGGSLSQWWRLEPSASWRNPHGRGAGVAKPTHPVVQVTFEDALAYARWRDRDLPTEAEWERAARGGLVDADYTWGGKSERPQANHWQGVFPVADSGADGYRGVAPVGCFPANGYGLHDMAGNVWELTQTSWELGGPPAMVIKGGSWLCADDYCLRYRPAARQPADRALGSDHIGFRTVWRLAAPSTTAGRRTTAQPKES